MLIAIHPSTPLAGLCPLRVTIIKDRYRGRQMSSSAPSTKIYRAWRFCRNALDLGRMQRKNGFQPSLERHSRKIYSESNVIR